MSEIVSNENSGQLRGKTVAVLGAGKMGSLILRSLIDSGAVDRNHLRGTVKHNEHAQELRESLQISIGTSNLDAARDADVVILCVKPSGVSKVAEAIRPALSGKVLVISIATGVTTESIEAVVGPGVPVIRAMPNTPCRIARGMTALCAGACSREFAYRDRGGHLFADGQNRRSRRSSHGCRYRTFRQRPGIHLHRARSPCRGRRARGTAARHSHQLRGQCCARRRFDGA